MAGNSFIASKNRRVDSIEVNGTFYITENLYDGSIIHHSNNNNAYIYLLEAIPGRRIFIRKMDGVTGDTVLYPLANDRFIDPTGAVMDKGKALVSVRDPANICVVCYKRGQWDIQSFYGDWEDVSHTFDSTFDETFN